MRDGEVDLDLARQDACTGVWTITAFGYHRGDDAVLRERPILVTRRQAEGRYRVLYLINDASRTVEATAISHRADAYRSLSRGRAAVVAGRGISVERSRRIQRTCPSGVILGCSGIKGNGCAGGRYPGAGGELLTHRRDGSVSPDAPCTTLSDGRVALIPWIQPSRRRVTTWSTTWSPGRVPRVAEKSTSLQPDQVAAGAARWLSGQDDSLTSDCTPVEAFQCAR